MSVGDDIKALRLMCLYSQEEFAKELGVSFSTVNRWERQKSKPNYNAMKKIDRYCKKHNIVFQVSDIALGEYKL